MATKKIEVPKKVRGRGYSGVWNDGTLGWYAPKHVSPGKHTTDPINNDNTKGHRFFLCEVVLVPIKDSLGRPITRIVKGGTVLKF